MARRAQGVAAALASRLDQRRMEGLPVIERADGTVGDVGTGWWNASVGSSVVGGGAPAQGPDAGSRDPGRSQIASRVAFVDEGVFPERRTTSATRDNEWDQALRSLDERLVTEGPVQEPVAFSDPVGGLDTLDEPDNIEPATSFIPFRTPAGHPEVVDTDTYVDYLIGDEFAKNRSGSARTSSRRFLRVLEGGTQPTRGIRASRAAAHAPRHFAAPAAAEA